MKINGKGGMSRTEGDEEYREVLFSDLFTEKGKDDRSTWSWLVILKICQVFLVKCM